MKKSFRYFIFNLFNSYYSFLPNLNHLNGFKFDPLVNKICCATIQGFQPNLSKETFRNLLT